MEEIKQLSREEALAFYDSRGWQTMSKKELALFQLMQERSCIPFSYFKDVLSDVLQRPVYTHEFADPESLIAEIEQLNP